MVSRPARRQAQKMNLYGGRGQSPRRPAEIAPSGLARLRSWQGRASEGRQLPGDFAVREGTDAEPVAKTAANLAAPDNLHPSLSDRLHEAYVPEVDPRQLCDIGIYRQVDLEARLAETEVDHRPLEDEPEGLLPLEPEGPRAPGMEVKAGHDPQLRQVLDLDPSAQEPHEQAGVDVVRPQLGRRPLVAPSAQGEHNRAQLLAGRGQVVVEAVAV